MRIAVFIILALASASLSAADRTEKIKALMEAQGLLQMFEQAMEAGRLQSREQGQQMLDQVFETMSPPPAFDAQFRDAFEEYMQTLEKSWTAQDVVDVWADKYGSRFSDQELDALLTYYRSPLGQKDVAASQAAMPEFNAHFVERGKPIIDKATRTYVQRLQKVAQQCKCQKK